MPDVLRRTRAAGLRQAGLAGLGPGGRAARVNFKSSLCSSVVAETVRVIVGPLSSHKFVDRGEHVDSSPS
eukprot:84228-Hanusia_phi.AAC.1